MTEQTPATNEQLFEGWRKEVQLRDDNGWASQAYLDACSVKDAVIAERDARIQQLKKIYADKLQEVADLEAALDDSDMTHRELQRARDIIAERDAEIARILALHRGLMEDKDSQVDGAIARDHEQCAAIQELRERLAESVPAIDADAQQELIAAQQEQIDALKKALQSVVDCDWDNSESWLSAMNAARAALAGTTKPTG
jgi:chromosome segregation ATPase